MMGGRGREDGSGAGVGRRDFLRGAAGAALAAVAVPGGSRAEAPPGGDRGFPGLIAREAEPQNLESNFAALDGFLTPTERFYVRNHFAVPGLTKDAWRLKVEGAVDRPLELTYDELTGLPATTAVALMECAGNGRVFLVPRAKGVAWELGAVGNAEWTGVPLSTVLERAGVRGDAVEVVLEGADRGELRDDPKSPGVIPFARSLPIETARRPDVLLAYRQNGRALTPAHGFPVRAVVPGWYGMASVKWLARVVVAARPFQGYFQTLDYSYFERRDGLPSLVPIGEIQVKAQVARPGRGEVVPRGVDYRIHGAAWAGESEVAKVEVSTDGGRSWAEATLLGEPTRHAWRLWESRWQTPEGPEHRVVMARATDRRGRSQPSGRDADRRHYMINHVLPVEVEVR